MLHLWLKPAGSCLMHVKDFHFLTSPARFMYLLCFNFVFCFDVSHECCHVATLFEINSELKCNLHCGHLPF